MSRSRSRQSRQRPKGSRTRAPRTTAAPRQTQTQTAAAHRSGSPLWYLLLLVPYAAMIWVSSYNSAEPAWAGIPFFYWYQLLWVWIG
jgi:hypothetical protein